jgi:formylglycine-generating enzyme required for sulfatase activity
MIGNVWEWVSNYYTPDEYSDGNTTGPKVGFYRVIRGGGWYSRPEQVSITDRQWYSPGFAEVSIGFRCAGR